MTTLIICIIPLHHLTASFDSLIMLHHVAASFDYINDRIIWLHHHAASFDYTNWPYYLSASMHQYSSSSGGIIWLHQLAASFGCINMLHHLITSIDRIISLHQYAVSCGCTALNSRIRRACVNWSGYLTPRMQLLKHEAVASAKKGLKLRRGEPSEVDECSGRTEIVAHSGIRSV